MSKLPVFVTVGRAYSFVFNNLGTIIRLSWLPLLIYTLPSFVPSWGPSATLELDLVWALLSLLKGLLIYAVQSFCLAIAIVAIHRVILFGDRGPGAWFHLSVSRAEFLITALGLAIFVAVFGLALVVVAALGFRTPTAPELKAMSTPIMLLGFAAFIAFVYVGVRFGTIYPMIVVTERLALRETWDNTRGNFWRIFGAALLAFLPVSIVLSAIGAQTMVLVEPDELVSAAQNTPAMVSMVAGAIGYCINIPIVALGVALISYAYKALAGYAPDEIIPSRAPAS